MYGPSFAKTFQEPTTVEGLRARVAELEALIAENEFCAKAQAIEFQPTDLYMEGPLLDCPECLQHHHHPKCRWGAVAHNHRARVAHQALPRLKGLPPVFKLGDDELEPIHVFELPQGKLSGPGSVYIISHLNEDYDDPPAVKIGYTQQPVLSRVKQFKTASPFGIRAHRVYEGCTQVLETSLHGILVQWRTNGEWFTLADQTLEHFLYGLDRIVEGLMYG